MDVRVKRLLELGREVRPRELFPVLVEEAASLIEEDPFAFALAAVLDRGTRSEVIWTIPYYIKRRLGHLDPHDLAKKPVEDLERILRSLPARPRYMDAAPRTVKELCEIVVNEYDGRAERIWENRRSTSVEATFQRIYGVGPGISSMITLLLEKCFRVNFDDIDHGEMDIKADTHVVRVFRRLGFISEKSEAAALQAARSLNPEYPGAMDAPTWIVGKRWCAPLSPKCRRCPLDDVCPKIFL